MAIADATSDQDLHVLGKLVMEQSLVVAGSGIAIGFEAPNAMGQNLSGESPSGESLSGEIPGGHNPHGQSSHESVAFLPRQTGPGLILSGSCSLASQAQVKHFLQQSKTSNDVSLAIDPLKLARDEQAKATWMQDYVACLARLFEQTSKAQAIHAKPRPPRLLVYATAQAESVKQVQDALGIDIASAWIESLMADLAKEAKRFGVRRFVVAGGETSGAVVQALDVKLLKIGAQIDPGVPWTESLQGFALALKSGNFGAEDFFTKALDLLDA
jgi:uncharacterized protein YgbK (DUF1537 family)